MVDRYKNFFNQSLEMLCIADREGRFVELNPMWSRVLGYSLDEMLNQPYLDYVHPDDQAKTIIEAHKIFGNKQKTTCFENRYRKKDGRYLWLRWSSTLSSDGLLYAVVREVTSDKDIRLIL